MSLCAERKRVRAAPRVHAVVSDTIGDIDLADEIKSFDGARFVAVRALDFVLDAPDMKSNRITHVVSVVELDREQLKKIARTLGRDAAKCHLVVPLDDTREEASRFGNTFFIRIVKWIQKALRSPNARVIIHCYGGISRSPTAAISYLVATTNMCVHESLATVRRSRPVSDPIPSFLRELEIWNARFVREDDIFVAKLKRRSAHHILQLISAYAATPYSCTFCGSCAPI
jgi:protein-tyrosine phosphatase